MNSKFYEFYTIISL